MIELVTDIGGFRNWAWIIVAVVVVVMYFTHTDAHVGVAPDYQQLEKQWRSSTKTLRRPQRDFRLGSKVKSLIQDEAHTTHSYECLLIFAVSFFIHSRHSIGRLYIMCYYVDWRCSVERKLSLATEGFVAMSVFILHQVEISWKISPMLVQG